MTHLPVNGGKHTVMECDGRPTTDTITCHHYGQHYEVHLIYNIFYNTTSKYINSDTCILKWKRKLVHQSLVHI